MNLCAFRSRMKPSFLLGLFFIWMVAFIWAGSSMLLQYLYLDDAFDSPFLVTYIGVALLTLLLPLKYFTDRLLTNREPCSEAPILTDDCNELGSPYQRIAMAGLPHDDGVSDDPQVIHWTPSVIESHKWTNQQHFNAALQVAPVWFIANWAYNGALALTSIASSTVIASTCSVFAFILAVWVGDERFGCLKSIGVVLGISGTLLTAMHDFQKPDGDDNACVGVCRQAITGDVLSLVAAVFFGVNALQIRVLCPRNEELFSMQLLLGYVGLVNTIALSPLALWKFVHSTEVSVVAFSLVVIRGLFDYVLSEYLHFRAVVLTNATVTSVGLGLTIPMGFAADFFMGSTHIASTLSLLGAGAVLASFVMVVLEHEDMNMEDVEEEVHGYELAKDNGPQKPMV